MTADPKRRHALREWAAVAEAVCRGQRLLVLADYDGTLTPIKPVPAQATMPVAMRRRLEGLSRLPGVTVGIISGRALPTLRRFIRLRRLVYVGNHGLELQGPGMRFVHPAAVRSMPVLRRLAGQLRRSLQEFRGALVESKRLSLSVHWRRVAARQTAALQRRVQMVVGPLAARRLVRVTRGKRVIEIRPPVAWHKGSAVDWMVRACRCRNGQVLFFGDDRTDEDAFRAVNRHRGISVIVGRPLRPTAARWSLRSPSEVGTMLSLIVHERQRGARAQ